MACNRITSGGRTWIQHDSRCPGRFNLLLCLFFLAEEELKSLKHHEHHCYDQDDQGVQGEDGFCECDDLMCPRRHPKRHKHDHDKHRR